VNVPFKAKKNEVLNTLLTETSFDAVNKASEQLAYIVYIHGPTEMRGKCKSLFLFLSFVYWKGYCRLLACFLRGSLFMSTAGHNRLEN
jgi:hypothetical protein